MEYKVKDRVIVMTLVEAVLKYTNLGGRELNQLSKHGGHEYVVVQVVNTRNKDYIYNLYSPTCFANGISGKFLKPVIDGSVPTGINLNAYDTFMFGK